MFFYPAVSGPKKRKRQSTADPECETTYSSDSDSSSTVDTSTSEGEDKKDFILPDYPSDELTSSESSESKPEEAPAKNLSTGWSERVTRVDTQFHGDHVGPKNIPDHINHESTALSFLELFLDGDFWGLLCRQTNLRAEQVKQSKPASYYAKNFKPVAVPELKAFLGFRLQMEKCVIKLRFGRGGDVLEGEERPLIPSRFQERYVACPGPRPGSCWPAAHAQHGGRGRARHA